MLLRPLTPKLKVFLLRRRRLADYHTLHIGRFMEINIKRVPNNTFRHCFICSQHNPLFFRIEAVRVRRTAYLVETPHHNESRRLFDNHSYLNQMTCFQGFYIRFQLLALEDIFDVEIVSYLDFRLRRQWTLFVNPIFNCLIRTFYFVFLKLIEGELAVVLEEKLPELGEGTIENNCFGFFEFVNYLVVLFQKLG